MMEDSNDFQYKNTINNLDELIKEKDKKDRKNLDSIFRTVVQGYSLFRFI